MKRIAILASALFLAAPALAQQSTQEKAAQDRPSTSTREPSTNPNPNASDKAPRSGSSTTSNEAPRVPTAEDRANNRDAVSGATLTGKVKSALAADVGLKTVTGIDVDSDKGIVTLKGKVDTADQKKRAEAVAKKVSGVKSVKNQLTVSGG